MRAVAALAAIIALLFPGPGAAQAQDIRPSTGPLDLVLDELAPRVVTAGGPTVLTVTGTLTNTGDVPVSDIGVRLQRGLPLTSEGAVRDALEGTAPTDAIVPRFQGLGGAGEVTALAPGAQVPVRLTVPLRGVPETGLALSGPGVYELLVNVNGVPEGRDRARLAAVRTMLPVIGLPAGPDGSGPVPGGAAVATPFSLLYPVTDRPRRLPTVPGEPVLLTDDTLADDLGPRGRLGGLVGVLADSAPVGAPVRDGVCVAVDPDLVATASAMSAGYQVVAADGSRTPGRGAETAAAWLAAFAAAARGGCVLALPFADADTVALTRGGLAGAAADAVTAGRTIVADLLRTPVLESTAWPADGLLDEATLRTLTDAGVRSVVLSADGVDRAARATPGGVVPLTGPAVGLVGDALLTLAAGGDTDQVVVVDARGGAARPGPAGGALTTQDLLGTVAFRAARSAGTPLLVAPPHQWAADGAAARALLDGLGSLTSAGVLDARRLTDVVATGAPADAAERALVYPLSTGSREVPASTVASIGRTLADIADLRSSVVDDDLGVDPDDVFEPLLGGAVRPASAAWRGVPADAVTAATATATRIAQLRGTVMVLEPPSPFSLATSDSPLLLTVANGLPVTMRVRVELASTSGLRVAPIPPVDVPPLGRRQIQASAEVLRSGVFTVDAAVLTQDGGRLGPPSRLQVRSTAYGTITLWLTGSAGVLLVVLAARRVLRRVRTEPGRNTDDRPRPGVPETIPDTAPTRRIPREHQPTVPPPRHRNPPPSSSPPILQPSNPQPSNPQPSSGPNRAGHRTGPNPPAQSERPTMGGPLPPSHRPAARPVPRQGRAPSPPVRPPGPERGFR